MNDNVLNVLLGLVASAISAGLGWLAQACWRRCYTPQACSGLESGVLYWHMVDLVWVLLFPLVYVLQ